MIILEESLLIKLQWGYWGGPQSNIKSNIKEEEIKAQIEGRPCADTGRITALYKQARQRGFKGSNPANTLLSDFWFPGNSLPRCVPLSVVLCYGSSSKLPQACR